MPSQSDTINASTDDSRTVNLYEFRGDEAAECRLENCVRSLTLYPATGEYAFDPARRRWNNNGISFLGSNTSAGGKVGDFALSMQQAFEHLPLLESVTIPYVWYATTSTTSALIRPGVVQKTANFDAENSPWKVGNSYTRTSSGTVDVGGIADISYADGTPSDASIKAAINWLHDQGKRVILQPIIAINQSSNTDSVNIKATSTSQVSSFLSTYRVFMEHAKSLLDATARAGITDSLIVGTGLGGISSYGGGTQFRTTMSGVLLVLNQNKSYSLGLSSEIDQLSNVQPSPAISFVDFFAINYSPALGSWTDDESAQTPAQQAAQSIYDLDYLRSQIPAPSLTTALLANQKILLHNIGCRSIHRGANAPNEGDTGGNGNQDNLMQRAYIEAILSYFSDMDEYDLSRSSVRAWDIRLHSHIHKRSPTYVRERDIAVWRTGFQLNGKVQVPPAPASKFGNFDYCNSDTDIEIDGRRYESMSITGSEIHRVGQFTNKQQTLTLPRNSPVIAALRRGRHPTPITLTIKRGHLVGDNLPNPITADNLSNLRTIWSGRVTGAGRVGHEVTIEGRAFSMGLGRVGVNERYQTGCGLVLYEGRCLATRRFHHNMAYNTDGDNVIGLQNGANTDFVNGVVTWQEGKQDISARITRVEETGSGTLLHLARPAPTWDSPVPVTLLAGCNHSKENCHRVHNNLGNYAGHPHIPDVNPFDIQPPVFY